MLTYHAVTTGRDPAMVADFDAFLDDRELPSVIRARTEREHQSREFVKHTEDLGGERG